MADDVDCSVCSCCKPECAVIDTNASGIPLTCDDAGKSDYTSWTPNHDIPGSWTVKACMDNAFKKAEDPSCGADKYYAQTHFSWINALTNVDPETDWLFVRVFITVSGLPAGCYVEDNWGQRWGNGTNMYWAWYCVSWQATYTSHHGFRIGGCQEPCCAAEATISFKYMYFKWNLKWWQCCCCVYGYDQNYNYAFLCCQNARDIVYNPPGMYCSMQAEDCVEYGSCGTIPPSTRTLPCYNQEGYAGYQCVLNRTSNACICIKAQDYIDAQKPFWWELPPMDPNQKICGLLDYYVYYGNGHSDCCKDWGDSCGG